MLNTHYYDGKIEHPLIFKYQLNEKLEKCHDLCLLNLSSQALHNLNIIISQIGTNRNYDITNNIDGDDLLTECWLYKDNDCFLIEFEYQLVDMSTGICAQGICHRLYQLLLAFQ